MAKKIKRYATGGVVERYSNPLFVQGMQGGLSAFGQSSTSAVYGNGGKVKVVKKDEGNYWYRRTKGAIGSFQWKYGNRFNEGILFPLDSFDKDVIKDVRLKNGDVVFRYETDVMVGGMRPLIKLNLDKGLVYFLQDSESGEAKFETRGIKAEYIVVEDGYEKLVMAKGGKIIDQYDGRTPEDVWNSLSKSQRQHFLYDHIEEIQEYKGIKEQLPSSEIIKAYNSDWKTLDKDIKNRFANHTREGQYAKGGEVVSEIESKYALAGKDSGGVWTYSKITADEIAKKYKGSVQEDGSKWYVSINKFAKGGEVEITNSTIDRGGLGSVQDSILADGGLLKEKDFEIGDVVTHKKGRAYGHGRIYKKTAIGFYLEDKFGNKSDKQYLFIDGWKKSKKLMGNGGNVDPQKFTQDSLLKKGGGAKSRVQILDDTKKFDESMYEGLLGDFDLDGLANVDDPNPIGVKNNDSIEQVKFSNVFKDVLKVKEEKDDTLKKFVDTLKKTTTTKEKIYGRTKTPYSILNKLVDKRLLHAKYGLMDLIGTTISFSNFYDLERYKKKVENGKLGRVIEFDDYYRNPNDGYRAYHFIIEYDGSPIELQLKTDRMKEINILSHDAYKNKMLNKAYMLYLTTLGNEADNGDQRAMEEFASLMSRKDLVKKKLTLSSHK